MFVPGGFGNNQVAVRCQVIVIPVCPGKETDSHATCIALVTTPASLQSMPDVSHIQDARFDVKARCL